MNIENFQCRFYCVLHIFRLLNIRYRIYHINQNFDDLNFRDLHFEYQIYCAYLDFDQLYFRCVKVLSLIEIRVRCHAKIKE